MTSRIWVASAERGNRASTAGARFKAREVGAGHSRAETLKSRIDRTQNIDQPLWDWGGPPAEWDWVEAGVLSVEIAWAGCRAPASRFGGKKQTNNTTDRPASP